MSQASETTATNHNHITRDIKPRGQCPACDSYWAQVNSTVTPEQLNDTEGRRLVQAIHERKAATDPASCTCTDWCSDDVSLIDCLHCATLDVYAPCPVVGFGCGSVPDQDCDCCTPEQRKAAAK